MKAKLFKKSINNELYLKLKPLDNTDYKSLILEMKKIHFKQIICSTDIILQIIENLIEKKGMLLSIDFTDNVDKSNQDYIRSLIIKLRDGTIGISTFIEEFIWITDDQSIDINYLYLQDRNREKFYIYSNGIIEGDNLESFFDEVLTESIKQVL